MTQQDYSNVCDKIKRWRSRLKRAVNMIEKLERQKARHEKQRAASPQPAVKPAEAVTPPPAPPAPSAYEVPKPSEVTEVTELNPYFEVAARQVDEGLKLPAMLDRRSNKLRAMPDPRSPEKKAERKAVAKEVREAELTGKRRKMPLSGKEALAAIKAS